MSTQLPLRAQRHRSRKTELKHQLIVFRLRQEWFALPLQLAQKVIPLGDVFGGGGGAEIGLTPYHDQEIPVLDIQQRIFGMTSGSTSPLLLPESHTPSTEHAARITAPTLPRRFLLIVQTSPTTMIGFPLDSPPSLRRVPESAFAPLSAAYLNEGQLRCVRCLIIPAPDEPPIFLLNLDQLLQANPILPESRR